METGKDAGPRARTPRWLRIAFAVSLALNLLVLGLVAGAALRFGGAERMRAPVASLGAALYRALPPEDRREMRRGFADRRAGAQASAAHPDAAALLETLRAPRFEVARVSAVLSAQRDRSARVRAEAQSAWLERVAAMSAAERAAYADRLEALLSRRDARHRR